MYLNPVSSDSSALDCVLAQHHQALSLRLSHDAINFDGTCG